MHLDYVRNAIHPLEFKIKRDGKQYAPGTDELPPCVLLRSLRGPQTPGVDESSDPPYSFLPRFLLFSLDPEGWGAMNVW
jgi:hypothetical protein